MTEQSGRKREKVAVFVEKEFEDVNFKISYTALKQAGALITIIGARMNDDYKGHHNTLHVAPEATAAEVKAEDFDAFVLLGGSNRVNPNVVRLIQDATTLEKWIVAIGYGPQVLIETHRLIDKQVTGFRAIKTDLENAGAIYLEAPTAVDAPFITARRPGDLPIAMTTLFRVLQLSVPYENLPQTNQLHNHDWWALGEAWGGSNRLDIIKALNTAIIGERYTLEEIKQYHRKSQDAELISLLEEIIESKRKHLQQLQDRLQNCFGEAATWQALGGETLATLQSWIQSSDDYAIIRKTLGDLQTGVIDAYRLCNQLSDPVTAEILDTIAADLSRYEQRLAALYRNRSLTPARPPLPTTVSVVH